MQLTGASALFMRVLDCVCSHFYYELTKARCELRCRGYESLMSIACTSRLTCGWDCCVGVCHCDRCKAFYFDGMV